MIFRHAFRVRGRASVPAAAVLAGLVAAAAAPVALQQTAATYTMITADARRTLPHRTAGGIDVVSLNLLAGLFGLTVTEDTLVEGLTIDARGQRILLIPGQSFAQVAGNVRSLSGPIVEIGGVWHVPIDFLSRALGPALGQPIEVRRPSRLIVVGDIRVPIVAPRLERLGTNARLTIDIQPATPARVTRDGSRLTIAFDAQALDAGPLSGAIPEFVRTVRPDAAALVVELGPQSATYRLDATDSRLTIDLVAPGAEPAAAPRPTPAPPPPPVIDLGPPGVIRTVVIDPGHGGEEIGAAGPGGLTEKDLALQAARRLKAGIETRMGLRVLLTRDDDQPASADTRSALANNNKADLFISLHVNAGPRPDLGGAQVLALEVEDYRDRMTGQPAESARVPVAGGGTRLIEAVPWDLAQIPHHPRSVGFAGVLIRQLAARNVPLFESEPGRLPLRVLAGANMPAVLVELGFLTNPTDEQALRSGDRQDAVVEAVLAALADVRRGIPAVGREREP